MSDMDISLLSYAELNVDIISIYKKLPFNIAHNFLRTSRRSWEDVKLPVVENAAMGYLSPDLSYEMENRCAYGLVAAVPRGWWDNEKVELGCLNAPVRQSTQQYLALDLLYGRNKQLSSLGHSQVRFLWHRAWPLCWHFKKCCLGLSIQIYKYREIERKQTKNCQNLQLFLKITINKIERLTTEEKILVINEYQSVDFFNS